MYDQDALKRDISKEMQSLVNELQLDVSSQQQRTSRQPSPKINKAYNRIIFGAPGTGKSYQLNQEQELFFPSDFSYERVTFHPAYSYAQFFGSYKPFSSGTDISYRFVPGPFLRVLLKALMNPDKNYLLIIEEINRADVAAVFGDVFQLLDRTNGNSTYTIDIPEELKQYLHDSDIYQSLLENTSACSGALFSGKLYIPANMYLWATMNSADQGVVPLDTAFKRRWQFEYIDIDNKKENALFQTPVEATGDGTSRYKWQEIRNRINGCLKNAGDITEDRWLGPFFLCKEDFSSEEHFRDVFKSKVLMYLFQDVAKYAEPGTIFTDDYASYGEVCKAFDMYDMDIFVHPDKD